MVQSLSVTAVPPLANCQLYGFVDTAYLHGRDPIFIARELCDGGVDLVQLRAKNSSRDEIRRLAEMVYPVVRAAGVWFVINDHPDIARDLDAPLCHLGQEDFFEAGFLSVDQLPESRDGLQIGLSSHAPDQALRAIAAGPAYVAIGPVFPTGTKPGRPATSLEYLRWAAGHVPLPWFAIGGITLHNLESIQAAGASRVCVVSALLNAPDISATCREFKRRLVGG